MKTENEDGSIMKSTIRYSFVAPGAIGRGRGRGLKSLTSKGKIPAKSLLFQPSDLVKQYIKEVETSTQHITSNGNFPVYKNLNDAISVTSIIVVISQNIGGDVNRIRHVGSQENNNIHLLWVFFHNKSHIHITKTMPH